MAIYVSITSAAWFVEFSGIFCYFPVASLGAWLLHELLQLKAISSLHGRRILNCFRVVWRRLVLRLVSACVSWRTKPNMPFLHQCKDARIKYLCSNRIPNHQPFYSIPLKHADTEHNKLYSLEHTEQHQCWNNRMLTTIIKELLGTKYR